MYDGIINVYKEKGFTSHDVVAKLRGILHQKKIGHTGTLDPDAIGVLPVCLGNATKLCDLIADKTKTYEAVIKLGLVTDTQDITGSVIEDNTGSDIPDKTCIMQVINSFVGEYDQIPPMYSALKVNGKKLYELARAGIEVERKPRKITINFIDIVNIENDEIKIVVDCSKGTYIRTLCHDIGQKLGIGACMKSLVRTRVSGFSINESLTLDQIADICDQKKLSEHIVAVDKIFESLPKVRTKEYADKLLLNGNKLLQTDFQMENDESFITHDQIRVYESHGIFKGVYKFDKDNNIFVPVKMFLG